MTRQSETFQAGDSEMFFERARGILCLENPLIEMRLDAAPEAFEAVKDQIADKVGSSRLEGEQKKYVEKLRAQAIIEWKNDDLKRMYDQKMAAAKTPGLLLQ